jgi:hypothetical protein
VEEEAMRNSHIRRAIFVAAAVSLAGCSRSNNLAMGRVEGEVGGHTVVVTDCYRTSVPPPEKLGPSDWRFVPCRDAVVLIRDRRLDVNGRDYGRLNPADTVLVDHGVVSVRAAARR